MEYVIDGFLGALGTAGAALLLGGLARLTPFVRRRVALWRRRGETLDEMADQFRSNGGASMFDRIARNERNTVRIAKHIGVDIEEAVPVQMKG